MGSNSSHLEDDGDLITTSTIPPGETSSAKPDENQSHAQQDNETTTSSNTGKEAVKSVHDDDDDVKIKENAISQQAHHSQQKSFAEVKEEEICNLNYIKPTSQELSEQQRLCLVHISHRGHYNAECEFSAQNLLQSNQSVYQSIKARHFEPASNKDDHDWIILRINSINVMKVTQFAIQCCRNAAITQYPSKICVQFMLSEDINTVVSASKHPAKWSKPHFVQPSILETKRPNAQNINAQQTDVFTLSVVAEFIDELYNNRYPQYVRVCLLDSHHDGDANADAAKYCVQSIALYGVPFLDDDNQLMKIQQLKDANDGNSKYFKYEIENKFDSALSPKPGRDDARVLMREHVFFISVRNKTVKILKSEICAEYDRLNEGNQEKVNYCKYSAESIVLVIDGYGFVNDLADSSVLTKTLAQIGVQKGKNNTGYYISVFVSTS